MRKYFAVLYLRAGDDVEAGEEKFPVEICGVSGGSARGARADDRHVE